MGDKKKKEKKKKKAKSAEPIDAFLHSHAGTGSHVHCYASYLHKHALDDTCLEPECASFPEHNVHNGPIIKLPQQYPSDG